MGSVLPRPGVSPGRQIQDLEQAHGERVKALERAAASVDEWRPSIEGTVDDIRLEVKKISRNWERAILDRTADPSGVLAPSPTTVQRPPADHQAVRPMVGHRVEHQNQESGFGVVSTLIHSLVKGESSLPHAPSPVSVPHHSVVDGVLTDPTVFGSHHPTNPKLPKVHFPKFDGDQPKLWLSNCLDYFSLYEVESSVWVRVARMHFTGAAARWYNSVES